MKRKIIKTADGSTTIHLEEWDEHYHSVHGAIQEAYHVFIKNGLAVFPRGGISVLEIGFGTGLNAFITLLEAEKHKLKLNYTGVEAYPVSAEELQELNYVKELEAGQQSHLFEKMHAVSWEETHRISGEFVLTKRKQSFTDIEDKEKFNLVYFDAFGPRVQPELWTEEIFSKMYTALKDGGVLVTYSAKGSVRRAMQAVGFTVERLPGPPGKREMLRATKHSMYLNAKGI
ncbi:tRNA (5-methylaminomethyl-2-thiouridine)(34)-methyltransferase MnmD [Sinomicrobium weinanense]|uniref:tRNA (5-methylaminomethyl-2-thiouridine)(34)-methyltransferase MnmD n=1 Tax=Sinomicrobium weinanense TaxID=2842200 RepID=A0A926JRL2_9FLAO|nr:tRNA (5-methylaminomethyl-2-thiouridine)(34)-methyltransferase MnmD [Sinomicrobium weinanense]MBC9796205.1 tRNA (5-methylaminomethyl-2-thiouridine)(34)-methyltransferase MnmD [Sinomicrobium weinanense]MBU3123484.1 tRNA (5-methylaminomethyl-2-thiouridine)(34)-methyltransferase MnmD [Sinomicrobium weinanense]